MWKFYPFFFYLLSCSLQYHLLMMNVQIYWSLKCFFAFARELNDNLLTGNIPPELGKLTDLFDLYVLISLSVSYYFLNNILTSDVLAEMSPTTTLKGLFLIILAHAQISTACKYFVLFLTLESFSHFKILLTNSFDFSNVHGNKLNGTIPRALRRLESMTNLWVGSLIVELYGECLIELDSFRNTGLYHLSIFSQVSSFPELT